MHCANCRSKLFQSDENEELFPGSELVFCYACQKKITPFLQDKIPGVTNVERLKARRRELELSGMTPAGISALTAYCAYLDRTARVTRTASVRRVRTEEASQEEVHEETHGLPAELHDETLELSERVESLTARLKKAYLMACVGGVIGVIGIIVAIVAFIAK